MGCPCRMIRPTSRLVSLTPGLMLETLTASALSNARSLSTNCAWEVYSATSYSQLRHAHWLMSNDSMLHASPFHSAMTMECPSSSSKPNGSGLPGLQTVSSLAGENNLVWSPPNSTNWNPASLTSASSKV